VATGFREAHVSRIAVHSTGNPGPAPARQTLRSILAGCCLLIACAPAQAVDWLAPLKMFGDEEEIVVWQGPGMYVKIVEQDRFKKYARAPKNDHPAAIGARDIAAVLASIKTGKEGGPPLFTSAAIAEVAPKLAEALGKVQSRQDVIFAVSDAQGKSGRSVTAARVFVEAGRLNLILGDTLQPGGEVAPQFIKQREAPWRPGRRREAMDSARSMGGGPGIAFREGARSPRDDWAIIDVPTLVAAYRGPQIPLAAAPAGDADGETNAQLLQERQQMRLEMARMRKQMESQQGAEAGPAAPPVPQPAEPVNAAPAPLRAEPAAVPSETSAGAATSPPAGAQSMEQRLSTLQALHAKKLITDEEYAAKRKKILDEL